VQHVLLLDLVPVLAILGMTKVILRPLTRAVRDLERAAGVLAQLTRLPTLTGAVLALPGAWMIATETSVVDVAWIRIAVVVVAVLGGACLASFEGNRRARSIGLLLLPLTAAGMYFTVPDTERAAVFFGVAAPFLCVGWLLRSGPSLGAAGSWALAALVAWITATGGSGRESSIVGGIACLGLFAVEPLSRLVARSRMGVLDVAPKDWRRVWAPAPAFTAHLALVYIASRVAGLRGRDRCRRSRCRCDRRRTADCQTADQRITRELLTCWWFWPVSRRRARCTSPWPRTSPACEPAVWGQIRRPCPRRSRRARSSSP